MTDQLFTVEEESPVDEGVALLSNGKVKVWFDGKTWLLRMPRLGEYRRFRTTFTDASDNMPLEEQEKTVVDWVRDVFTSLAPDPPLPEESDEWPVWMTLGFFQGALIRHWTIVPLARGANGATAAPSALSLPNL